MSESPRLTPPCASRHAHGLRRLPDADMCLALITTLYPVTSLPFRAHTSLAHRSAPQDVPDQVFEETRELTDGLNASVRLDPL